jgi:hypothetical protein
MCADNRRRRVVLEGPVDADPTWSFDSYQAYEDVRFQQSLAEQEQALSGGLVADPKSQPHGGYRIACVWPEEVTASACALSARLAELLPETPAYPYQALHSSVGNIAAPGARLVDPDRNPEDRKLLDCLADSAAAAVAHAMDRGTRRVAFDPALLARRMAFVFGRPQRGYWALHSAIHAACAVRSVELVPSWGPHLTVTRFGRPVLPEKAAKVLRELKSWAAVTVAPTAILVGWYTVGPGDFRVDPYHTITLT